MKRHLPWLIPLACFVMLFVAASQLGPWTRAIVRDPLAQGLTYMLAWLVAVGGIVTCIVLVIRGAARVRREWRHRTGHFNKREVGERVKAAEVNEKWSSAREQLRAMRAGSLPQPFVPWGIIAEPGEVFFYSVHALYQRYYGRDVSYTHTSGFFMGSPAFVTAGLVANAIGNSVARSRAEQEAAEQWREQQMSEVLLSNRRMLILVRGQWVRFDFAAVIACYPDPAHWNVAFQFQNAAPLMLIGIDAPLICAFAVLATHGADGLEQHPALDALR